jgi:CheY-like chemotaxis protein
MVGSEASLPSRAAVCAADFAVGARAGIFLLAARRARIKALPTMRSRPGSGTRNLSQVRRVLIVDDNHDSAELIALVLDREGHETRVAHDPREAIPLAVQFRPSIAFLDIGLPGMDGFELLRVLREKPELAGCKFVAVTGYEELGPALGGEGFDGHLIKPIDLSSLVSMVLEIAQPALVKPASA